ncbi:MAG TPA: magnesium transporter [Vicinamibacteria bacterium]|nr:magnesium transporter [Vicinamibacteria bacterium]
MGKRGKSPFQELLVGCVNGVAIGSIVALMALVWKGHTILGLVIAISMIGNLLVAALAGTLVPITLMWLKVDPASASSVFVTTVTDACGFLMFLELGELLLGRFS